MFVSGGGAERDLSGRYFEVLRATVQRARSAALRPVQEAIVVLSAAEHNDARELGGDPRSPGFPSTHHAHVRGLSSPEAAESYVLHSGRRQSGRSQTELGLSAIRGRRAGVATPKPVAL